MFFSPLSPKKKWERKKESEKPQPARNQKFTQIYTNQVYGPKGGGEQRKRKKKKSIIKKQKSREKWCKQKNRVIVK